MQKAFFNPAEGEAIQTDSIQLITCQKAKGLQWQAVIVPFLFNDIGDPPQHYPCVIQKAGASNQIVVIDNQALPSSTTEWLTLQKRQELQRVLYVALTRAKHTLVLIDDEEIFEGRKNIFGGLLELDREETNLAEWKAIQSQPRADSPTIEAERFAHEHVTTDEEPVHLDIPTGIQKSESFMRRVLPHTLAKHGTTDEPEARRELAEIDAPLAKREKAIEYGLWWHALCEHMPWSESDETKSEIFENQFSSSPDPSRARVEWALLLASDLWQFLNKRGLVIHSEVPFTWKRNEESIIEGIIDFAALDPSNGTWMVVDWKTDRTDQAGIRDLVENYRPQIETYASALRMLTGKAVDASIYSTTTGAWMQM